MVRLFKNDDNIGIYEMGISAALAAVPTATAVDLASELVPKLIAGMSNDDASSAAKDGTRLAVSCMVLLKDVIGMKDTSNVIAPSHSDILNSLLGMLNYPKTSVRLSAVACRGALSVHLDARLLNTRADTRLTRIERHGDDSKHSRGSGEADFNATIQAFSLICKNVGHRLGGSLERIVPVFLSALGDPEDVAESEATNAECLIKENILVALRRCVEHCPGQVNIFLDDILSAVFGFMRYDPNFCELEDDDEDEDEEEVLSGSDSGSDFSDLDSEDDDQDDEDEDEDASWKVRRAAVRVIRSFISSRPDLLSTMYVRCTGLVGEEGPGPLVERFLERNPEVCIEVIMCVRDLLQASGQRHINARAGGMGLQKETV